jgi:hypothetical protein
MSSASHDVWVRRPAARWAGLTALVLLAGCGGERRESSTAGTEGAAVTDTAAASADTAAPPADTATRAGSDLAAGKDTAGNSSSDTDARSPAPTRQPRRPAAAPRAATPEPSTPKPPASPQKPAAPSQAAAPPPDTGAAADTGTTAQAPAADSGAAANTPEQAAAPTPDTGAAAPDTAAAAQGGAAPAETATAPLRDEYHQAPRDTVDQVTYNGWKQYNLNCARCHGEDVLGTTIAPHLLTSLKPNGPIPTQEAFVQVVCAGRPAKGMPSWCALGMEPETINQIYAYVKARSEGKIGPGRPAVKEEG